MSCIVVLRSEYNGTSSWETKRRRGEEDVLTNGTNRPQDWLISDRPGAVARSNLCMLRGAKPTEGLTG